MDQLSARSPWLLLRRLLELVRFSHTVFALPFALAALVMAWAWRQQGAEPRPLLWREVLGVLLCMVTARNAAMAFNRLADQELDAQNPRTAKRHLPAGLLSRRTVVVFWVLNCVGFVAATALFLPQNPWPLRLSVPVLAFICGYSYTKRFTWLAHFWLGAALLLAPVCTWIALVGLERLEVPLVLGLAVLFWVAGFDIIYACQDEEVDRRLGLRSVPARWGTAAALRLAAACHAVMLLWLALLPQVFPLLGWKYYTGIALVALLLVYEHRVVSPEDLSRVNVAFFQVNAVISLGLLGLIALDVLT